MMAQLTYKNIQKFRYLGHGNDVIGEESVETLRENILKAFVAKQLNTNSNLEEILNSKKEFSSGETQQDISSVTAGLLTNENFKKNSKELNLKSILSSCELNELEIEILLNKSTVNKISNSDVYDEKLQIIVKKLEFRQKQLDDDNSDKPFANAVPLNRHDYEEECKKVPSIALEKLTPCLVKLKPHMDPMIPADHPINNLPQIVKALFPKLQLEPLKVDCVRNEKARLDENPKFIYFDAKPRSFWDMKKVPIVKKSCHPVINEKRVHSCSIKDSDSFKISKPAISVVAKQSETRDKQNYSKPFVWSLNSFQLIPIETINNNKLDINEIKKNPKFRDYNPGSPSRTLFIKNLSHKLPPISLVSLFGHFENQNNSKIEYRILKGRMKGQAFVKFRNLQTAEEAFLTCNGFVLEGKPIVIEYSKKQEK